MWRALLLLLAAPALAEPPAYLDDRSDAASLVRSYYNAINRGEHARAYGYFAEPAEPYERFAAGFADTASVELALGTPVAEGAAGSIYTAIPVAIRATDAIGKVSVFAGCTRIRQIQPAIQEPPFRPLEIVEAHLAPSAAPLEMAAPAACPAD